MKSRIGLGWIPLLLFAFLSPEVQAQDIRVEASVNANRIGMDDDLQLTVSIYGDGLGRASAPTLPQHDGFRVAGQSQSTSIQWINGQMSATRAIIYRMTPVREGKHVIDSISVTYQGTEYLTEPIEVDVVSGSVLGAGGGASSRPPNRFDRFSPPRRRNTTTGKVFVEAVLSSPSVYVGEQVILNYRLYTQVPIVGLDIDQRPQLTGFWVEEVQAARDPGPQETTIDGEMFYVFDINQKNVLFPTKAGEATIGPATFSMGVRASSDPFDSFFFRSTDTIRRASQPVTLEVKPLPTEGRPRNFSGAVGQYELGLEIKQRDRGRRRSADRGGRRPREGESQDGGSSRTSHPRKLSGLRSQDGRETERQFLGLRRRKTLGVRPRAELARPIPGGPLEFFLFRSRDRAIRRNERRSLDPRSRRRWCTRGCPGDGSPLGSALDAA